MTSPLIFKILPWLLEPLAAADMTSRDVTGEYLTCKQKREGEVGP
jgi:hypothetical protein